jgi:hypothetical protein
LVRTEIQNVVRNGRETGPFSHAPPPGTHRAARLPQEEFTMYPRDAAALAAHLVFITAMLLFAAGQSAEPTRRAIDSLLRWLDGGQVAEQLCRPDAGRPRGYLDSLNAALSEIEGGALVPYDAPACGG